MPACSPTAMSATAITPRVLLEAMDNPDRAAAKRAFEAMMTMQKIDVAKIEAALRGDKVDA